MRIVVVSDSHGEFTVLRQILRKEEMFTDMFIHCGDSMVLKHEIRTYHVVKGNCDFFSDFPKHLTFDTPLGKIYVMHGEMGLINMKRLVAQVKPDIILYGHTHVHSYHNIDGCHCLNPGSVSRPRDGKNGTYLVIEGTSKSNITWEFKSVVGLPQVKSQIGNQRIE